MSIPKVILAIILGAIVSSCWNFLSWGPLQLHQGAVSEFTDTDAVADVLVANAPEHGVYYIPSRADMGGDPDPASHAAWEKDYARGPFVVAFIRPGEVDGMNMQRMMLESFATQAVGALIAAILLCAAAGNLNYIGRVLFVGLIGLFTGIVGFYPGHTWWEYPMNHVTPYMIDATAGWLLAGVFMGFLIKPKREAPEPEPKPSK